ncbi:MAG: oxygen-insensitive NADPH nitroreductase [Holophaga sp.]|jgi:nitroreductase
MNEIIDLLRSHRTIRRFTAQAVDDGLISEIVRCGQAAPTSSNIQATTVIHVRDPRKRGRIAEIAGGQSQVAEAGAFLVFCADLHRARIACEMQGGTFAGGMTEHFIIATVDVALAAQNCAVAAESLGLGICYIGAVRNDPQAVADLLELPESVYPVFGMCLGYPDQAPEVKPRLPLSVVLKADAYRGPDDLEGIRRYDLQLREYYRTRTGGQKDSTWSAEMKALVGKESRPHMRSFLARRGFTME